MDATGDDSWQPVYRHGLDYYREHLFTDAGAPRWMNDQEYPYDIHGAAQGILTFSRHLDDYPGFAARVADWTLANMYDSSGRFYYQKSRLYRRKFTLMRWCNGWMARALASLLAAAAAPTDRPPTAA